MTNVTWDTEASGRAEWLDVWHCWEAVGRQGQELPAAWDHPETWGLGAEWSKGQICKWHEWVGECRPFPGGWTLVKGSAPQRKQPGAPSPLLGCVLLRRRSCPLQPIPGAGFCPLPGPLSGLALKWPTPLPAQTPSPLWGVGIAKP